MEVSFAADLDDGRPLTPIGRVRATTRWRAAGGDGADAERQAAIEALTCEAAEYGADAVVDVQFEIDGVKGADIDGVAVRSIPLLMSDPKATAEMVAAGLELAGVACG